MYKLVVCFCACMMMYVCCMSVVFMYYTSADSWAAGPLW